MSPYRQDNGKTHQKKLAIIFAVLVFLFFLIVWSFWWMRKKPVITEYISETVLALQNHLSSFNDDLIPPVSEVLPIPTEEKRNSTQAYQIKDTVTVVEFDSTYYFFLWDKLVQEFDMNELDSLTIDSLVKIEMQKTAPVKTNETASTDETYSLKKDELIYVTSVKPALSSSIIFSSQDSTDFSLVQNNQFTIEFWKSPVNYQGIKSIGNSVVVFGMSDFEHISINFISKNNYCLKINNKRYALKNDGKFYNFRELLMQ